MGYGRGYDGGLGGWMSVSLSVTPGELLYIFVGGKGNAYNSDYTSGGGESDIRTNSSDLTTRLVVTGGGGGGGVHTTGAAGGNLNALRQNFFKKTNLIMSLFVLKTMFP